MQVPICPLCGQPVPVKRGEDPNLKVNAGPSAWCDAVLDKLCLSPDKTLADKPRCKVWWRNVSILFHRGKPKPKADEVDG